MPRARSASVASASGTRRSTRAPSTGPASAKKPTSKAAGAAPKAKRARSASVAIPETNGEAEEDEEEGSTGTKRKARATTPKAAKPPVPKKIKVRVPVTGINPLPTPFPGPTASKFDFPISPPVPEHSTHPRTAFVFGNGDFGQHGLGVAENVLCEIKRPRPQAWFEGKIEEKADGWEDGIAGLECGGMHTLAVDKLGRVWSWGINDNAALGRSTSLPDVESEELETQPMLVEGLDPETFKAVLVAAGDSVSLAVSDLGEVRCWGSFRASEGILGFDGKAGSSMTQLTPVALPNLDSHTIVSVATGNDHFLALTSKGQVFACGNGEQNQLGRKIIQRHKTHGLTPERLSLRNIITIGSGGFHSFAVNQKGQVYAWGLNSFRQTGVSEDDGGWSDSIATPTLVSSLDPAKHGGARVVQITGGEHHSIFLFSNGEVWACGRCDGSEVGLGPNHPEMVLGQERKEEALKERAARQIVELDILNQAGGMTGDEAALKAAEAAAQGVPLPNPYIPEPQKLTFPIQEGQTSEPKIVRIASGPRHNFAASVDGFVFTWGFGNTSQLGLGPDEDEAEMPTRVKSQKMEGYRALSVATGGQHSVIVAVKP
ncbi:RCC1/BLIP-II [Meredithblackwellia eburnea MCA 4105]